MDGVVNYRENAKEADGETQHPPEPVTFAIAHFTVTISNGDWGWRARINFILKAKSLMYNRMLE